MSDAPTSSEPASDPSEDSPSQGEESRDGESFAALGLPEPLLQALDSVGYEVPSPIQALTIPHLLAGRDLVGQAQTGTGKTAAFALPVIASLDLARRQVQAIVLTPTRELALQVAEAFQRYASRLKGFQVLPIYGGQGYEGQLRGLRRGVHVVVGTPGRVMDHMRRGTLSLDTLRCLVLDEADEMLRMGFLDDVEWVLEHCPAERQIALFSATMPNDVRRIAQKHLRDPQEVLIESKATTAETVRERYWTVSGVHKLDALTRILEAEPFEAMLIFVRTKIATVELAEKLQARGFAAAHLSGDIPQRQRERLVERLRSGDLDLLVCTDVAARGLDVDRVSHVVNYDVPYDLNSYVHRVGRTGRAGRSGEAILFVTPRERRVLRQIERASGQKVERMQLPTMAAVNDQRVARFHQKITDTLEAGEWKEFHESVRDYQQEHDVAALDIAAALAKLLHGDEPLLLDADRERRPVHEAKGRADRRDRHDRHDGSQDRPHRAHRERRDPSEGFERPLEPGMERYRVEVGKVHNVRPGNLVGAIASEGGLDGQHIGRIDIYSDFSLVDLPEGMPREVYKDLRNTRVMGQRLAIQKVHVGDDDRGRGADRPRHAGEQDDGPRPEKRGKGGKPGGKKPRKLPGGKTFGKGKKSGKGKKFGKGKGKKKAGRTSHHRKSGD